MGGDAMGSNGYSGNANRQPKVFRLNRMLAAGYTSSFRMGQLLQWHVTPPIMHGDELAWVIKELVPVIRQTFKQHGYANVDKNEETGGVFLLAVRDRLFKVQRDYSVLEAHTAYDSVGSGEDFALGAMHALWKPNLKEPRALLRTALDAASAFATGVSPPYSFISTVA